MTARKEDVNGYISIEKNPISRVGVFPYLGRSISSEAEPDRIYYVYRPESTLSEQESIDSFKLLPIVDDHDMIGSSKEGLMTAEKKGVHGSTGDNVFYEDGVLYANLRIFSENMSDSINDGKTDLSLGYRCAYEKESGVYNGQNYEYVQVGMRGNHLALVEEARCDVSVLDHNITFDSLDINIKEENIMAKKGKAKIKLTVDNAELSEKLGVLAKIAERLDLTDAEKADIEGSMAWLQEKLSSALVVQAASGIVEGSESTGEDEGSEKESDKKAEDEDEKKSDAEDADEDKEAEDSDAEKEAEDADEDEDKEAEDEGELELGEGEQSPNAEKSMSEALDQITKLERKLQVAEDNNFKRVMSEVSKRDKLAREVSPLVGAFDASEMSLKDVAKYAVKKLKISCDSGEEISVLKGYLSYGKPKKAEISAMDSSGKTNPVADYINGK